MRTERELRYKTFMRLVVGGGLSLFLILTLTACFRTWSPPLKKIQQNLPPRELLLDCGPQLKLRESPTNIDLMILVIYQHQAIGDCNLNNAAMREWRKLNDNSGESKR